MMLIAIDPDTALSGLASLQAKVLNLQSLSFWRLIDWLDHNAENITAVHIEAGWLHSKANFHTKGKSEEVAARVGSNVGANAQVGKLLADFCILKEIPVVLRHPLKKRWGKDGRQKISHREFLMLEGVTPKPSRTNQEERDAALLLLSASTC